MKQLSLSLIGEISLPIEYLISTDLNLAYAQWSGRVRLVEFRKMFPAYLADQNYLQGRPELCDFSNFTDMDADFKQIWSALHMVNAPEMHSDCKTKCVVYAPSDLAFGFARMYQSLAEQQAGVQVAVCSTQKEVFAALNLEFSTISDLLGFGRFHQPSPSLETVCQPSLAQTTLARLQ
ncbi:hypothetical protein [Falsihalocynthiibacter arcticus]|uniref:Uncharacterized protein n=1 Tax=Falsihalocynthiibacter arcticus TaxID=1579316 RepID=A0A126V1R3_9RHOB|nr:hypothetical protein [Falsihalocynthiibacter arcticus]AML51885.1 hypothetical protein RC74_11975 [Falsihalocynthiibacter arcticus]